MTHEFTSATGSSHTLLRDARAIAEAPLSIAPDRALRIAIVSPLTESVPPKLYGGTERVVSYLTEELVRQGHDVTLFASGDSTTGAHLRSMAEQSLRLGEQEADAVAIHARMLEQVVAAAAEFDIVHFHIDYWQYPPMRQLGVSALTTMHGRLDVPDLRPLYHRFRDMPLVSISNAQRTPLPEARWLATIPHGLPPGLFRFQQRRGSYLAFLGRMSPEKRPDRAIRIARRCGIPLRIAAKIDKADREYFDEEIRPMLDLPGVEFIGEIGEKEKDAFLGGAMALLFPIDWPEPFGLVMIEAMACGTPVVAYRRGSIPEVVSEGVTGYVVDDEDEAVAAVERACALDRAKCRDVFQHRFTVGHMTREYVRAYRAVLRANASRPRSVA